jgi:hypothetical protein
VISAVGMTRKKTLKSFSGDDLLQELAACFADEKFRPGMIVIEESMPEGTEVEVVTADEGGVHVDDATEESLRRP